MFLLTYPALHPSAELPLVQLLGVVFYPFIEDTPSGRAWFGVFAVIVQVAGLRKARRSVAAIRMSSGQLSSMNTRERRTASRLPRRHA